MLITIYNLPSSTQYTDVKALLHSVCGLREGFVLDNLVVDGINKKITVGLAEEEDGALLTRKINGYYYNGKQLYVQDVRKSKKNSEQPYHSSSKNMVDNSMPAAPPLVMTTPYYNMQASGQYYGMPQTNYMNYASQQQPNFQMSQVQYPGQVHSQAPLGLSTEASSSGVNEPWYRNSQNNYQSYSSQSYSDTRPEKRSINDRSDDNYSAVNKKSKQDDSYYRRSSPSRERAANDRGWQASGGDNKPDRSNANDYERRNNDWNQIRGYYSQPNLATYSESDASWGGNDRGNENKKDYSNPDRQQSMRNNYGQSDSKFDRNDKTSMDYGTYRGKADDRHQKSNNYGQSNQQFGRNNSVPVNRNQPKKEPGKGNFNTYHWPPAKFGPSRNVSGPSSDFYKAQNKNPYRNQDTRSRNNQVWDSTAYNDASRYMPPSQYQESSRSIKKLLKKKMKDSNPAVIARKLSTWCSQATAFLAKEILRNVGLENQSNDYVLRQLKAAISKKIDIISNQNIESYEHLVSLFRSRYQVQNDQKFYDAVLKDMQMNNPDGTPATSGPSKPKTSRPKDIEDDDEIAIKGSASKVKDFFLPNKKKRAKLTSKSVYAMSKASKKAANRIEKKVMKNMKSAYLIPTYPEGDKSVYVEHKQLLKEDLAGATNFILKPAMAKALEAELDDIVEIVKKATLSKNDFIYRELQKSDVAEGFKKALKIQLSKRLLNLGPVGLRIFGVPKLPSRSRVAEFLLPYKVISLKPSKKYAMFIAECEDYVHADKLLDLGETEIDGMTLSFKPLQLVAPQSKVKSAELVKFRKEFIKRQIDDSDIDILDRNNREPYELKLQTVEQPIIELDDEAGNDFDEDGNCNTNDICDADNSVIIQEDMQVEVCDLTEEADPANTQDEEVKTGPVETTAKDESNNEAKSLDKIENVNDVQLSTDVENVDANNDLKINTNVKNDVKIETDVKNDVQVDATVKNDVQVNTNVKNDVTKVGKIVGGLNNDGDEKDETVANVDIGDIDEDDLEDY